MGRSLSSQAGQLVRSDRIGPFFSKAAIEAGDSALLQGLLDRLRQGHRAARQQLLERARERVPGLSEQSL
jgi:hypothetical protein